VPAACLPASSIGLRPLALFRYNCFTWRQRTMYSSM
jgi:hypothetical protein